MVPESRGDTTRDVWTIGQAALGPVSLVRGARGNRASSRAGLLNARSRSPARAGSVDDLTGVAAQAATRSGGLEYRATTAQWHAERAARRPKQGKLAINTALRAYVEERLAGGVVAPSGALVPGPAVSWKGRRHGRRRIGGGQTPGARSRSPAGSRSTSLTMTPCASAMKPSIKRCSFKDEARCGAS